MQKLLTSLFISLLLLPFSVSSVELGGITMPDQLQADGQTLVLNGAGIRGKFVFDLYVAGLYLTQKNSDAEQIIQADKAMALRLDIISSKITSEKMTEATREGFEKSTNNNTDPISTKIGQFLAAFDAEIVEGDVFEFIYVPGSGVEVLKNGAKHATVPSLAFKQALFGIWLSDKPVKEKLKNQLLGK